MSVLFTSISSGNPVEKKDVQDVLDILRVSLDSEEEDDFHELLAAVHDCAEEIQQLPDYQPTPDRIRYPRVDIYRPSAEDQFSGQAWAHRFLIRGAGAGLLNGKRVCLKDVIAVADVPQLYGTDIFPPWTPTTDATVVTRVLDAGGDVVGTTTCENLCHSTSSFTSAQGAVDNPFAVGFSAGGSTSGGAAVVGGGLVDIAIGTDQGGSIRIPSAFCGCVGFKPTHGLVPYTGISSGDAINDHAGPIAKSVLDAALCLDAISGYDGIDDRSLGAAAHGSTNFAVSMQAFHVDPKVREVVIEAANRFERLGATVEEVSIPAHLRGPSLWTIQQRIAGSQNLVGHQHGRRGLYLTELECGRLPWTTESFRRGFPATKNVIINGLYLADRFPGLYGKAVNLGRQLRDVYQEVFERYDVLLMPTAPTVAPRHGKRGSPIESLKPSMGITINTAVFNVTGHPAMTIPVGFARSTEEPHLHLPVGMQIVGGLWKEDKVLRAGYSWEKAFNWKEKFSS
ncbi:amidase [Trichoderma arundinaceum]|uniref:Amidase n=1 Tax=Trichoderma arundinaceum TaxID=490622 RepID=A0A395NIA0_TRIAR|nr:amidase [Trichoderma arundinaceum]